MAWNCPECGRAFRRPNQRHACGAASGARITAGRPEELARLYDRLETLVHGFGEVEVVTRDRYALFRTTRIFADLTVTRDALRVVVHLAREARDPMFVKVAADRKRVAHVAPIRTVAELKALTPYLREAYRLAAGEEQ